MSPKKQQQHIFFSRCHRLFTEDEQGGSVGGRQRLSEETAESDAAYLVRSTACTSSDEALQFVRQHVGMSMIDALSLFKRQLVEKDQRRAQEIADTLLSSAAAYPRTGCVVASCRTSYQYCPPSPVTQKLELEREARAEQMSRIGDEVFQL